MNFSQMQNYNAHVPMHDTVDNNRLSYDIHVLKFH